MGLSKGMGYRRGPGIPLRLTKSEKKKLKHLAKDVSLSMAEFARCKIFDVPFDLVGGKVATAEKAAS